MRLALALLTLLVTCGAQAQALPCPSDATTSMWCSITTTESRFGAGGFLVFTAPPSPGAAPKMFAGLNGGKLDQNGDLDLLVLRKGVMSGVAIEGEQSALMPSHEGWTLGTQGSRFARAFLGGDAHDSLARILDVKMDDYGPAGSENVAGHFQANKYGKGATWGLLSEVEDPTGAGYLWGAEIDLLSRGDGDAWLRRGLGIVLGVNQGVGTATIGYGIDILPFWRDRGRVDVMYGIHVGVPARVAAIAVQAGQRVALEESGRIAIRFNPNTNAVEIVNGERVLTSWGVQ
jgi:hypothetical protein